MYWLLLWLVLLAGAATVFWMLGRDLYRKGKALSAELTVASDRLVEVSQALAELEQAAAARHDPLRATPPSSAAGQRYGRRSRRAP